MSLYLVDYSFVTNHQKYLKILKYFNFQYLLIILPSCELLVGVSSGGEKKEKQHVSPQYFLYSIYLFYLL